MQTSCAVILADRRKIPSTQREFFLSSREQDEIKSYGHPERQERTSASRILTKFLLMQEGASEFRGFQAGELDSVAQTEWKSFELLSGESKARTRPTIFQGGQPASGISASTSHCGVYTASCISRQRVGIDLENIQTRRPEFYKNSFSQEEQDWALRLRPPGSRMVEAAFTFLWSVKEAYLKTASSDHQRSIWAFPRWTVWFDSAVDNLLTQDSGEEVFRIPGGIRSPGFVQRFVIGILRFDKMLLATVQY